MLHPQPQRGYSPRPRLADFRMDSSLSVASAASGRSERSFAPSTRPLLTRPDSAMSMQSARSDQSGRSSRTERSLAQARIVYATRVGTVGTPQPSRATTPQLSRPATPQLHRTPTIRSDVWVPPLLEAVRTPSGVDYPPSGADVYAPPTVDIPETERGWRKWVGLLLPVVCACTAIGMFVGLGYGISITIRHLQKD